jgi:hypothetical protein
MTIYCIHKSREFLLKASVRNSAMGEVCLTLNYRTSQK